MTKQIAVQHLKNQEEQLGKLNKKIIKKKACKYVHMNQRNGMAEGGERDECEPAGHCHLLYE